MSSLDPWIRVKAGIGAEAKGRAFVEALEDYQLGKVNETIGYARRNTAYYRDHLASLPIEPLRSLSDLSRIPFTTPSDIIRNPYRFLAVTHEDVARTVTLRTSGSTGESKQLFFTEEDLELTMDFFHHGVSTFARPGEKMMVLLPGERPDSVGDLLARGLRRMGLEVLVYGPVADPVHAADAIASFGARHLVGIPTQILAVACSRAGAALKENNVETVVLTADYVPQAIAKTIGETWGCRIFNHYGMTEMGLGGGFECEALGGYHLREADLYFEVVDHESGGPCPDGAIGEIVCTTLTRRGMPLIRYRTGDMARTVHEPCPCGSALRRIGRVRGRWDDVLPLGSAYTLTLPDMDEALFQLPGLLDYRATASKSGEGRYRLDLDVQRAEEGTPTESQIIGVLEEADGIKDAVSGGYLELSEVRFQTDRPWTTTGVLKRKLVVKNDPARSDLQGKPEDGKFRP